MAMPETFLSRFASTESHTDVDVLPLCQDFCRKFEADFVRCIRGFEEGPDVVRRGLLQVAEQALGSIRRWARHIPSEQVAVEEADERYDFQSLIEETSVLASDEIVTGKLRFIFMYREILGSAYCLGSELSPLDRDPCVLAMRTQAELGGVFLRPRIVSERVG